MMSVTRSSAGSLLALVLVLGGTGCDSGEDIAGHHEDAPSDHATDAPEVATAVTLEKVGKQFDLDHRTRVKESVTAVVDPWLDGAFLGDFPREDYTDAFVGFTEGAAVDAERDIDLMSNQAIADQIDTATATKRRVRVNVFAPEGHPHGITAHFVLDFTTAGDLEESMRVRGDLYLSKDKGEWKIFGYDVDQAEQL